MGHNRRWREVSDAARYNADIVLCCRKCEHTLVIDRKTFLAILRARNINDELGVVSGRLRCHRCRERGPIIEITSEGDPRTIGRGDRNPSPPRGIPLADWLNWTDAQRERAMRRRR